MRMPGQTNNPDRKRNIARTKLVGGQNHAVKAEQRLGIGVTEIGVGNDLLVDSTTRSGKCVRDSMRRLVLGFCEALVPLTDEVEIVVRCAPRQGVSSDVDTGTD